MPLDHMTPEQVDALGRMNKKIYNEYKNLGFTGLTLDPVRFLAFRKQTNNDQFLELVVSDSGVYFIDLTRKIKYTFNPGYYFVYHDGLHPVEEEKVKNSREPLVVLDNLLEFWNRPGTGLCLVMDHLHHCDYLLPEQKAEMKRTQNLYSGSSLEIKPMFQKKSAGPSLPAQVGILDLEE
jgi:hypothetical protein